VTDDIFDQVQQKLTLNMKHAARNNKSHQYLLRALVSCGACQSACISRTTNTGQSYYACRCLAMPLYSGHDKRCRSRYIPADQLDAIVWCDVCRLISQPEAIIHALQRSHDGHWLPQQLQARRETLRKAQAAVRQQMERLTEAYLGGIIRMAEYQRRRRELDTRDAGLEQQSKELGAQVDRQNEISQMAASIEEFCHRVQSGLATASFVQKRTLLELLVDRVLVINDQVEIRYVVPTHPRGETTRFCHLRKDYFDHVI
jgi:site-specific DNA recombinase